MKMDKQNMAMPAVMWQLFQFVELKKDLNTK